MKYVTALVAIALALGCSTVQAGLINPGFETGSLTIPLPPPPSWDLSHAGNGAQAVQSFFNTSNPDTTDPTNLFTPLPGYGNWFLQIATGAESENVWRTVTQSAVLTAGQTLYFAAGFSWGDYSPFLDGARIRILEGNQVLKELDLNGSTLVNGLNIDDYGNIPWTTLTWLVPATKPYTIEYGVVNTGGPVFDTTGSSHGFFDMVVPAAVPEPVSLALYVIGLASLLGMQRRRTVSQCRSA